MERGIVLVGLNHRTAPVELRERLAVSNGQLDQALRRLMALEGIAEAAIVSTCNRVEVVACGADADRLGATLPAYLAHEHGGIGPAGDDLDPVARRHDGRFGDPLERHEASQRLVELPVREREALAQLDRGGAVVQTDDDDPALHAPRTCRGSPARAR